MASINYFLRGTVPTKEQTIWLKFRDKKIDVRIGIEQLKCKAFEWKDGKCKNATKKMHPNDNDSINTTLSKIQEKILSEYREFNSGIDIKSWLKISVNEYFNGKNTSTYSNNLINFIDTYLELRDGILAKGTISKIGVLKSMLIKYTTSKKLPPIIEFSKLDNYFKDDFEKHFISLGYKYTTIYNKFKDIKTIAKFAKEYDIIVNPHIENWKLGVSKFKKLTPDNIYLTLEELDQIENTELPHNYLDNARDWLIISCFTGQRVGDFLRFNKSMISTRKDNSFIEFTQEKTKKQMRIFIIKSVKRILDKRNGEFPRKISDVKYNKYIKEVCEICKINTPILGQISQSVGKNERRGIIDMYPKYKLVASHIGRRSFATNYYGKIPTPSLMYMTGHTSEAQFLEYINKSEIETADTVANFFNTLDYELN